MPFYSSSSNHLNIMKRLSILLMGALALSACSDSKSNDDPNVPSNPDDPEEVKVENISRADIPLTAEEAGVATANNGFALKLFAQVAAQEDGNTFVSPFAIGMNLTMLANGANDEAAQEICDVMDLGDLSSANAYYSKMLTYLPKLDNAASLEIASSVWYAKSLWELNATYRSTASSLFSTQFMAHSYTTDKALKSAIVEWCSDNTEGMIDDLDMDFNCQDSYLVNSLYFDATWNSKFDPEETTLQQFTGLTSSKKVDMMYSDLSGAMIFQSDNFKGIELPYGNEAFSMVLLLPESGSMAEAAQQLSEEWEALDANSYLNACKVYLPRFEISCDGRLKDVLSQMGISKLFEDDSMTEIWEGNSTVMDIKNFNKIQVAEEGSKAVAVVATQWATSNGTPTLISELRFDHPFFFLIREKSTGSILFTGSVKDL